MKKNEIAYDKKNAFVVDTTAIQVKIKGILKDDIIQGISKEQTDKKVIKAVDAYAKGIRSPSIRERYLRTIAANYKKWYTMFALAIEAVKAFEKTNIALIKAADTKGFGGIVFNFNTRNVLTSEERGRPTIADYKNEVKKAYAKIVKELSKEELKELSGGTLRNYAEIRVRWEANRDDIERLKNEGVINVWASSHANCSERCSHWQGQLYSLYDEYGTIDGIPFQPLAKAMRGINDDGNGLLGYNCRHRIIPYFSGSTPPKEYTEKEVAKAEEIDSKQRYMERKIRKKKEDAYLLKGVDNKLSKELFAQARELTDEYRAYSEENNRPAYIYRTQIMREEMPVLKEKQQFDLDKAYGEIYNDNERQNKVTEFAKDRLEKHFSKHSKEFPKELDENEYISKAKTLLESEPDGVEIYGFTNENGFVFRYNVKNNEFATSKPDGTIETIFKPKEGMRYFTTQMKKDGRKR